MNNPIERHIQARFYRKHWQGFNPEPVRDYTEWFPVDDTDYSQFDRNCWLQAMHIQARHRGWKVRFSLIEE